MTRKQGGQVGLNSSRSASAYEDIHAANFLEQIQDRRREALAVRLDLANLAERLNSPKARMFATEGIGRRLGVIQRCVLNVFELFPPDRDTFLNFDECDDIAIQLHAFAINVYALFDNLAWMLVLEAGLEIPPLSVGLFKKACQPAMPKGLQEYVKIPDVLKWHHEFAKPYRDSTAHRIPLYLPSREYTPEEGAQWQRLNSEAMRELVACTQGNDVEVQLARHAELERQKNALGRNTKFMALSLKGENAEAPVYMHPQLLCDWALVNELICVGIKSIREDRGWPAYKLPPLDISAWVPRRRY